MLDGLLGRSGFSSKCKSLIKPTRTRLEALRRRAEAKQRFLKEDLVKLLANGLDVNAYGRTEEFIAGLNLLSCYTFIDQSCEYILKQLSIMQKLGPCPEECRETVASLMFAAARFSDLPELRDLRDVFQEKYGNGLECFVNQTFVEKLASKPPVVEKRINLLQDIAAEFSIQWDSKGFKQRMDKSSTVAQVAQDQAKKVGPLSVTDDKYKQQNGNNIFRKNDHRSKERMELPHQGPTSLFDENLNIRRKELFMGKEDKHQKERKEHHHNIIVNGMRKEDEKHHKERKDHVTAFSNDKRKEEERHYEERKDHVTAFSNDKRKEEERHYEERKDHITAFSNDKRKEEERHHKERKDHVTAISNEMRKEEERHYKERKDHVTLISNDIRKEERRHHKERKDHATAISNGTRDDKQDGEKSIRKVNVEEAIRSKSTYNSPLPPPYVKLNIPPPYSKPHNPSNIEKIKKESHHEFEEDERNHPNNIPLPKPRSVRRKHSKSSSSHDDIGSSEDTARIVKRISSSKRKERKGLRILFDDEHYHGHRDEEEQMMDKLLIHYSKKPSAYDVGMLRKKKPSRSNTSSKSPSPHHKNKHENDADVLVPPTRSISLPHEQSGESEPKKVYARANSFQPDNQAKHVHPKLPDYDDLAARFAALRGR